MGTTPRPWQSDGGRITNVDGPYRVVAWVRSERGDADADEDQELIVLSVNAFDALLAVAKAVGGKHSRELQERREGMGMPACPECAAIVALDAAHPGWREWAP